VSSVVLVYVLQLCTEDHRRIKKILEPVNLPPSSFHYYRYCYYGRQSPLSWLTLKLILVVVVGATLACGTGACAVVVAAVLEGHTGRSCTVDLPGGPLEIEWSEEDNHVYMTGPAEAVFYGKVPL